MRAPKVDDDVKQTSPFSGFTIQATVFPDRERDASIDCNISLTSRFQSKLDLTTTCAKQTDGVTDMRSYCILVPVVQETANQLDIHTTSPAHGYFAIVLDAQNQPNEDFKYARLRKFTKKPSIKDCFQWVREGKVVVDYDVSFSRQP